MMRNIREMLAAVMAIAIFSFSCMPVPARTVIGGFGNVNPVYNGTYDVGSPSLYWDDGYFTNLHVGTLVAGGNVTAHAPSHASTGSDSINHNTLANLTTGDVHTQYIKADGTRPFAGAQSMGGNSLVTMADPTNNQDAATKYYVDTHGNVTGTDGIAHMIPYWTIAQNLNSTNMYYNATQNRYGIGTTNPELALHIHDGTGPNGIQLSYTIGALYTNITSDIFGYLGLMPSGGRVGINDLTPVKTLDVGGDAQIQGNLTMDSHNINDVADPSAAQDAVTLAYYNAHLPAGGSGNVTTPRLTSGYIPVANSTTNIVNSVMFANGTLVSIPIVTGAELCPTIAAVNWTGGAGWTVGAGTLTRVASAVTTAYPTVAIAPDIAKYYLVTFTISGWTAGTVTMTFGGVESTPIQGNQNIYLYISPYTAGSIIFTPSATFAGVISAVSVKEYTGGELKVDGGVLFYDSRGHPNRLSHVTRHLSEMQTDTLLDKSRSTLTCSGGVLTYTLFAVYGEGTWNFNGIVYPSHVASANVSLVGGTDVAPKTNWVYFDLDGNTPRLAVSTTGEPTTTHIMVAEFIVGAVSGSSYTIYGYNRARTEVDSFVKRVIGRFENSGSLYVDGSLPTVTSTTLSIASGGKWYQGIFEMTAANTVTVAGGYYYIKNGVYATATTLAPLLFYSDGSSVGAKKFTNIVWGIVPTTITASGTLPTTVKLVACLQMNPAVEYGTLAEARQDLYDSSSYYPPDQQLKEIFVPVARTIVKEGGATVFQLLDTGIYWRDLRGVVSSGGGAAPVADAAIKYTLQVQAAAQAVTTDSQTLYWGSQQVAPSTTADRWRVYIPKTGTIRSAYIYSYAGTAGTNSAWSMYVRLNNTSDTLIQTLGANTNDRVWSSAALDIAVAAGDYIEIKEVQPAWATNPADVTRTGIVYIE